MTRRRHESARERRNRRENRFGISAVLAIVSGMTTCGYSCSTENRVRERDRLEEQANRVHGPEFLTESEGVLSRIAEGINDDPHFKKGQPVDNAEPSTDNSKPFSITNNPGLSCLEISNFRSSLGLHFGEAGECGDSINGVIFSDGFTEYESGMLEDSEGNIYTEKLGDQVWRQHYRYMIDTNGDTYLLSGFSNSAELGPDGEISTQFERLSEHYLYDSSEPLKLEGEAATKLREAHEESKVRLADHQKDFDRLAPELKALLISLADQSPEAFFAQAIKINTLYAGLQSLKPTEIDRKDCFDTLLDSTQEWNSEHLAQLERTLAAEGKTFEYEKVVDFLNSLEDSLYNEIAISKIVRIGFDHIDSKNELEDALLQIEADGNREFIDPANLIANTNRLSGKEDEGSLEKYESYFQKREGQDREAFEKFGQDPRAVAHEITNTQGRYSTRSSNMFSIIGRAKDPYGECEARLEHAYSRWHRFFGNQHNPTIQYSGRDVPHVRLLFDIDGIYYAVEKGTPTVIDVSNTFLIDPNDYFYGRILGRPIPVNYNGKVKNGQ